MIVLDGNSSAGTGAVHLNPNPRRQSWEGYTQVDDRPGQSFLVDRTCTLDHVSVQMGRDEDNTAGVALVRIYAHGGTYGVNSQPANAAPPDGTPTRGWLAESDQVTLTAARMPTGATWYDFAFTGSNRVRLTRGPYVLVVDWRPTGPDQTYFNTVFVSADASRAHPGNAYIDGDSNNNGVRTDFDLVFQVHGAC